MSSTPSAPPPDRPAWRVGTLSYSSSGLRLLSFWLLFGDFVWSMRERAVLPVIQRLFGNFGASDLVIGLALSAVPSALTMIVCPIVGYCSDRTRTRWGRRIPYLAVPIPILALALTGLAFSVPLGGVLHHVLGARSPGLDPSILIVMTCCFIFFEMACFVGNSIFGALVNDVVPSPFIGRFFGLFRAVGLVAGVLFFFNFMRFAAPHYAWIFLGVGVLYTGGISLMCLNVKEGKYPPVKKPAAGGPGVFTAVRTYFREGLGQPYYLLFFAATALGGLTAFPFNFYSVIYSQKIGMSDDTYGKCLALTYACSLVLSYPLGMLADRYHPLRTSIVGLGVYAIIMAGFWFVVHDAFTFGVALVIHGVVSGCIFTSWASLSQRLLPRERFAELSSVGAIIGSLTSMAVAPAVGRILDLAHHNYRYTFPLTSGLTAAALVCFCFLYRSFVARGGDRHYVAP